MAAPPETSGAVLGTKLAPWLAEPLERLESALATQRLGHAWLLTGPPGVGKINLALVFAARLLSGARGGPEPLEADEALRAYGARHEPADHHPDLHWVFPADDKQSIGVDQVREISEALSLKGFSGAAKVVVIEPAEAMTAAAANALLKTLEEPTPDTYLLLVCSRPGRLPATIRSRCQQLVVAPPAADLAAAWLEREAGAGPAPAAPGPFRELERSDKNTARELSELRENIEMISRGRLDPQTLADRWLKADLDRLLGALTALIAALIRARIGARGTNSVTEAATEMLHNAEDGVTLELLFEQLDAAERLRDRSGHGINVELAVRFLLSGFKPV